MNLKLKTILLSLLILLLLVMACGCSSEASPYDRSDAEGYRISVRYDANGGFFTTNTYTIVDAYDLSAVPVKDGKTDIALLRPDDAARGNDAFTAVKSGHFLAGWYAERTEIQDAQGNITYTYGKKWDFEKDRLTLDANGSYSSAEPELTLYAAWVPLFSVEFYDLESGQLLNTYTFDPTTSAALQVPNWNQQTGTMDMFKFPQRPGYTFQEAYYDAAGTQKVTGTELAHTGAVDSATGTAKDPSMKLYIKWTEGEWYHIYNVDQFLDNASVNGSYVLHADLDFTGKIWPTALMYGNYSGIIQGNGHTISNVQAQQTNNSKVNAGLFGALADTAQIFDLKFSNITFTIKAGTRVTGASYGLLAGAVSSNATLSGVSITASTLQIDSGCYFSTDDYVIGLICGTGKTDIDPSGITTAAVGSNPETVKISVEGQTVNVEFVTP